MRGPIIIGQARIAEQNSIDDDPCIDIEWMGCMEYAYGFMTT